MSADLLRRAAAELREHAEAATPGPWEHVDHGPPNGTFMGCGTVITMGEGVEAGAIAAPDGDCYPRGGYSPREDMAFIALMHPPVALALADWLETEALSLSLDYPSWKDSYAVVGIAAHVEFMFAQSLATARAILREDPS